MSFNSYLIRGHHGHDRMVVGFTCTMYQCNWCMADHQFSYGSLDCWVLHMESVHGPSSIIVWKLGLHLESVYGLESIVDQWDLHGLSPLKFASLIPACFQKYKNIQFYQIKFVAVWWFSQVSSTYKTDHHNTTVILLKVALNIQKTYTVTSV